MSVEEIEAKRAARKATAAKAREEQYEKDLAALDALEEEFGDGSVAALEVTGYVAGLPTLMVVKSPGKTGLYKRYSDMVRRSGGKAEKVGEAQDMLGTACIAYPDAEVRKAMFEAFPGMAITAAIRALKFVELEAADEKKS